MTGKLSGNGVPGYSFNERDVILEVDGDNVYMITDLMDATDNKKAGDKVEFTVYRNGNIQTIMVELLTDTNYKSVEDLKGLYKALGIYYETNSDGEMINGGMYSTSVKLGFFETIGRSFEYSFKIAGTIFTVLGQLLTGALGLSSIGGTITTLSITADAISIGGLRYLLNIASFIGVNLAVFNLLPIPALDGSRIVFTIIEWIRGKPINRKVEGIIHAVGFVLILGFAILVDLLQLF